MKENVFDEKKYPLKLNPNYYVVSANDLIKGRQKMTLREAQLLFIAMSQVVREDKDFKTYVTTVKDLADFMHVQESNLYRDLEDICTLLLSRVVKIKVSEKKWKAFQWISGVKYENGKLTIRLHDDLKPYLLDLVSHYSQTMLQVLCEFRSYYTCRLYQLIICEIGENPRNPKETWEFTCEELREFFQIDKKQYKLNRNLIDKTIKPALEELNQSDYCYIWGYEEMHDVGKGSPLKGVKFSAIVFNDIRGQNGEILKTAKSQKDFFINKALPIIRASD